MYVFISLTSLLSTITGVCELFLKAVCRTARCSVKLTFSPVNISSLFFSTFLDFAWSNIIIAILY